MYDRTYWEQLWAKTLRDHPEKVASKQPNATMIAELAGVAPGRVLDAGCGHGAEALWLAARGWKVTAVDFSADALAHGRQTADAMAIADSIQWICGDLATWNAPAASFDLVACLYVHCANGAAEMIQRLANAVAPGGTLFVIGHRQAADQIQISVDDATAVLDAQHWNLIVAEERPRASTGTDAVIRAQRI
jgi:2-polyprenyl-3-methyl-5-hydroxy-6-metoxy-1,4-benzoquinol methylase